ncbi:DUF4328 domain-containing protein [Streptomyces sp. H27-G5]|uniref:DUF4328 domain-containing protein n=1 Tax=Streptomyces sp. H27-G5 TaxID=2996698 RepID=UPI002270836A|nr:DUF4328 domain-containing protein [Streptomyces sp. H27-G5]MCY0918936.1 DUF4328 domain-containing protein [Streptomyces sp. H27-G5]
MSFNKSGPPPSPSPQSEAGPTTTPPPPAPHPAPASPPQAAGVLRSPEGLVTALTVLLAVGATTDLVSSGVHLYIRGLMKDLVDAPAGVEDDSIALADLLNGATGVAQTALRLATIVVFIIWFHRVRCNGQVFRPDGFSQSAGWAIGGWFVPFANLFFPYRTARETWEASTQRAPDGSYRHVSSAPVTAWWTVFVAAMVLDRVFSRRYVAANTAEAMHSVSALGAVTDVITIVAAVLAVVFVRKLTALQRVKAAQGPIAAS